ncbi:hypothetical protein HDV01_001061 [Terramyces sp. JEL0728]|nr:hypothetical protein HDV01_001061 [Terramyces sp. JEL0728]
MKQNNTCDYCILRKRKCSRGNPCDLCDEKSMDCRYSTSVKGPQMNEWDDRIRKLEVLLIVPYQHAWQRKIPDLETGLSPLVLTPEMECELFDKENPHLLELGISRFNTAQLYIREDFLRNAALSFKPLYHCLCATGSLFTTTIPQGVRNRLEMANIYLLKAEAFPFISERSIHGALTLVYIAVTNFRLQKPNGYLYLKYAIQVAKNIGLQQEAGIDNLAKNDQEKEDYRCVFWFIFQFYGICRQNNEELIDFAEIDVHLPSNRAERTSNEQFARQIVNSGEWHTPSVNGLSFQAYRVILAKIQIRINQYSFQELSNVFPDGTLALSTILASLRDLERNMKQEFNLHEQKIKAKAINNPKVTWLVIVTKVYLLCLKIVAILPKALKLILSRKKVQNSAFFMDGVEAAIQVGNILSYVKDSPSVFKHWNLYIPVLIVESAFILLCALKLKLIGVGRFKRSLGIHYEILIKLAKAFNREPTFYNILKCLEEFDIENVALRFGEFKASSWHINSQQPLPEQRKIDINHLIN